MRLVGTMRSSVVGAFAGLCALWALAGCSSDEEGGRPLVCTPGAMLACECPNGRTSTASCLPSGRGTGPCACADAVDAADGTDGGSRPPPDAGGQPSANGSDAGEAGAGAPGGDTDGGGAAGGPGDAGDGGPDSTAKAAQPSAGCGSADAPSGNLTLEVGGVEREYIVTLPSSYEPNKPHRLIFAWHGLGGRATQVAATHYGLAARAANSAIFIAAQGLPSGAQAGLAAWSNRGDADVTFTRRLLEWAKANYCVDVERVFSIGMSNGGMMSNVVGCELGDAFRAIAALSGGGPRGYAMAPCTGQVAVWIAHGNRDFNVPFSYGQMSRDYWRSANDCDAESEPTATGDCVEYQGCDPGFPVHFCAFDGGHTVPSFAAEAAWRFFEQF